jgi:hypothetical protein
LHAQFDHIHGPLAPTTVTPNVEDEKGATKQKHPLQLLVLGSQVVIPSAHTTASIFSTERRKIGKRYFNI